MPRYSDVVTGKISPSHPVPYEQAIDKFSLDFFKAIVMGDYRYINDLCYGIGFMYHKRPDVVQDDLVTCADKHAERVAHKIGIGVTDMRNWEKARV